MHDDVFKSLKNITTKIGSGATPRGGNSSYQRTGISLIRSQNVHDFKFNYDGLAFIDEDQAKALDNVEVIENDILLNITGDSIARACLVPKDVLPARVNQHVSIIRCIDMEDADYVLCYLQYLKKHLLSICKVGGTRNALTKDAVEKIVIIKRQNHKKTGQLISRINTKIELNNKINHELEAMAKTLYDYWFMQFDFPNEQGKPYKSSGGKMFYNAELKREIPEGWEVKKLSVIATTGSGGTPLSTKKEYYENGNIPWINSGEVNMPFIVSTKNFITQKGLENSSAKIFNRGTILMAMYGATAGKVSFMDIEACTNQAICAINPKEDFFRIYLKHVLEDLYKHLINLSSGSARDNLSQDKIRELKFVIPSKSLIQKFDEMVQSPMNKIVINLKQNQQLSELRDWLLPMLMNGQVTLKVAEERLSMAAEPKGNYKNRKEE